MGFLIKEERDHKHLASHHAKWMCKGAWRSICQELPTPGSARAWGGGGCPSCAVRRTLVLTVGLNRGAAVY